MAVTGDPRGWDPTGTYTWRRDQQAMWVDCPTCWRAGRIHHRLEAGWGWTPCSTCLGVGQIGRRT